jgi:hypothetical protein
MTNSVNAEGHPYLGYSKVPLSNGMNRKKNESRVVVHRPYLFSFILFILPF